MLQTQHDPFIRGVTAGHPAKPPKYVEVLDGVARELMPAVWALGLQCGLLRLPADLTPRERRFMEAVDRSAQRIARVLAGVHSLVLAEAEGGLPLAPLPSEMEAICEDAVEELREAGVHGEITYEGDGDGGGVWDAGRLSQAISYLVECAFDAGPEEPGVRLHWSGGPRDIVLVVERSAAADDTERGMDLEWGAAVGAGPEEGVKASVARKIVLAHGGTLARFAASRTVAYVAVLPRRGPGDLEVAGARSLAASAQREVTP